MTGIRTLTKRLTKLTAVLLLASWQVVFALSPLLLSPPASALASGFNCVNDTAGANDEPGQKDLTKMCVNYDNVPTTLSTTWNWDDLGTSGANTLDACNLFDTNNDGNIDYAVCVTTTGNPASIQSLTTYSCGNDRVDRCSSPKTEVSSGTTSCTISSQNTDPFPAGDVYPADIEGACTIQLSTVGGTDAKLVDVCSYPSQQPNSDPSDCVVFVNEPVALIEVVKDVVPDGPGLFNLSVDGPGTNDTTTVNNIGDGGTTGLIALTPPKNGSANATVSEAAGTNTNLSDYTASISCVNRNGGAQVASGNGTSLVVSISDGSNIICTITNTLNTGSLTVSKLLDDNGDGTFETSNPSSFTWSLDGSGTNAMGSTVSGITTGSHSVNENTVANYHFAGWYLTSDTQHSCANPTGTTLPASVTVSNNTTTGVTLCNARDTGTLRVLKNVDLNGDGDYTDANETGSTAWQWQANGGANHTTGDAAITVPTGDYALTETAQTNFHFVSLSCTGGTLTDNTVTVAKDTNVVCTFVNARDTGLISFLKVVDGGTAQPSEWTFTISGGNGTAVSGDSKYYATGTYTVTEAGPANYTASAASGACSLSEEGIISLLVTTLGGTCTITNTRDTGTITVHKVTNPSNQPDKFTIRLRDDTEAKTLVHESSLSGGQSDSYSVDTGDYVLGEELIPEGWDLASASCTRDEGETTFDPTESGITISKNDNVDCTFTNNKRGTVTVTKYNDLDRDGTPTSQVNGQTVNDPTLSDWEITLSGHENQTTGENGTTTFTNVSAGRHTLDEVMQDGWTQRNIHCNDLDQEVGEVVTEDGYIVSVEPGANVQCFIGNYQALELNLVKTNNRPAPTVVGDTVTYTLTASVPTTSGTSFNSFVSDLPPEGFVYVPGSWTASVKHADGTTQDLKENGTTPEPAYGSPGTWLLGALLPGDVVTLTYQTVIQNSVNAGTYPDLAFASGCDIPTADCVSGTVVYSNLANGANDPFVGTDVSVTVPQVLGASTTRTILVNTGAETYLVQLFAGIMMAVALALAIRTHYSAKGGRS